MRQIVLFTAFTLYTLATSAQTEMYSMEAMDEISAFQNKLNEEYKNRETSPLEPKAFKKFKGHDFFPLNLDYRVKAKLTVTEGTPFFGMKTTTSRLATERIYGYVEFTLAGQEFRLPVYQSKDLMNTEEYADHLFFPFTDLTNGKETYPGGRYIDLWIPAEGTEIIVDFNQAYNPYCAYSHKYSCPIVPAENHIDMEVPTGVMYKAKKS